LDRTSATVPFEQPRIPFASGLTGRIMGQGDFTRHYWRQQSHAEVRFDEAVGSLLARGARVFLVAGPEVPRPSIPAPGLPESAVLLGSLRRGEPDWRQMLDCLEALYLSGVGVDWAGFDRDYARSKVEAPTYPFQHRDYARVRVQAQ